MAITKRPSKTEPSAKSAKHSNKGVHDFTNDDDVKASQKATAQSGSYIKINENESVPVYFLSAKYVDGYAHFLPIGGDTTARITCAGGLEGKGFAPVECPICKYVESEYRRARELVANGRAHEGEKVKKATNKIRASYDIHFIVAKGSKTVKKLEGKKKIMAVDFEDAQVGVFRLTRTQRDNFYGSVAKYDFLSSRKDLLNRYIMVEKKKIKEDDEWATFDFVPASKPSKAPEVEIPEEVTLDGIYDIDMDKLKKALKAHLSGDENDEDVDYENDDEEDDVAVERGKKKKTVKEVVKKSKKHAPVEEDDEDEISDEDADDTDADDDDFEDDEIEEDADEDEEEDDDAEDEDIEEDDEDEEVESDDDDEEIEDDDSSEFDDDFLDDVDDEMDDDAEEDDEEPAVPKKGKKPAKEEPVAKKRGRPAKEEPVVRKKTVPARSGRTERVAPSSKSKKPAPSASRKATGASAKAKPSTATPARRGRPAKAATPPARKGRK